MIIPTQLHAPTVHARFGQKVVVSRKHDFGCRVEIKTCPLAVKGHRLGVTKFGYGYFPSYDGEKLLGFDGTDAASTRNEIEEWKLGKDLPGTVCKLALYVSRTQIN